MTRWSPRIDRSAAIGVAVFALAGVGAGLAIKPSPRELIGPEGPQTLSRVSGERVMASGGGSAFAGYRYGIPDYVIGTDWLQPEMPVAPPVEAEAYEPPPYVPQRFVSVPDRAPDPVYRPPEPRYPSVGGDIYASAPDTPPPPEPPEAPEAPEAPLPPEPPPA